MAHYSLNTIRILGPWPSLARLALTKINDAGSMGAYGDSHLVAWEPSSALGPTLALRGRSRHAEPLADCFNLSEQFPNCVILESHLHDGLAHAGWRIIHQGAVIIDNEIAPDTLAMWRENGLDSDGGQSDSQLLIQSAAEQAYQTDPMALDARQLIAESARQLDALFDALFNGDGERALRELALALTQEPSLRGLSLLSAAALFDLSLPELDPALALASDADLVEALCLAPVLPVLTPRGFKPGGQFALSAEARSPGVALAPPASPDRLSISNRVEKALGSRQTSGADRIDLFARLSACEAGRRCLNPQSTKRLLLLPSREQPSSAGARELAERILAAGLFPSDELLVFANETLTFFAGPQPSNLQSDLARIAAAMEPDHQHRLALHQNLPHWPLLLSSLERDHLRGLCALAPAARPPRLKGSGSL